MYNVYIILLTQLENKAVLVSLFVLYSPIGLGFYDCTRTRFSCYQNLVRGAIRLPIVFLRLNTMLKGKKQRKVTFLMKLVISNFRCPGETHITNFTRLPLHKLPYCNCIFKQSVWNVFFLRNSPLEKFIVIVKQKDRFGVIFLLLWLSEHTQGVVSVVSLTINIYFTHLKFDIYIYIYKRILWN